MKPNRSPLGSNSAKSSHFLLRTVAIALALSGVACILTLMLQAGSLRTTLGYLLRSPVLLILNWLPMALTLTLVLGLCGNLWISGGITVLLWGVLSYVNLIKTEARGDPFVPGDVMLLFEGIEAVGSYQLSFHFGKLALLLGVSAGLIAAGCILRHRISGAKTRITCILVSAALFAVALAGPYASESLYNSFPGPSRANVPQVFDCFGFPYAFLHNFRLYPVDEPEDYSQSEAAQYEQQMLADYQVPEVAPNILMIMCEAFTDLPNASVFTHEEDPIGFYNSLIRQENTINGQMIVSNIGAGTANTEFDVLTGMMTNKIGIGTTSAFRVIHRNTDSLPRMLAQEGYQTFFTHPGYNWFYNRESVYNYLGITDQVFNDVYTQEDYKGSWIKDDAFLEQLISDIQARNGDAPLFIYGVTIQNHQSYTWEKYGFQPAAVQADVPLSDEAQEYLSVYFEGLRDSDRMLENLVGFLEAQEEPWLLVFFGDHQPNLGPNYLSYRELGLYPEHLDMPENRLTQYTVPYVIWGNEAYHQTGALPALEQTTLSSHYLGALTAQAAGFSGIDGYFDYLNALREQLPVCSTAGFMTAQGEYLEELPQDLAELEELRWHWQYYRLKHETIE